MQISHANPLYERCGFWGIGCYFPDIEYSCGYKVALHCKNCGWPDKAHTTKEYRKEWVAKYLNPVLVANNA